jgi:3-methyl-2-oxobutanoate hydroxymethyltransferase
MKVSLPALAEKKLNGEPIVMITAYDHATARIVDRCGVDIVLVGDSAANNVLGHDAISTVGATMEELLILTRAVAKGCDRALVVGDLPFMSYQVSNEEAVRNAGRFIKEARADVVKLEGGGASVSRVAALKSAGIAVMGHIGLTPQTATALGGHKAQGREWHQAHQVYQDAVALQAAGCFAIVLECVPGPVSEAITKRLTIPTIGIGAGPGTDGQVLVFHDLLGFRPATDPAPKFVKRFAEVGDAIADGVTAYSDAVRGKTYPDVEHTYSMLPDEVSAFEAAIAGAVSDENVLADW